MNVITILFHDVVENYNWDSSGFPGTVEARYKLNLDEFKDYLSIINQKKVYDVKKYNEIDKQAIMLAFDDGGVSFLTLIANELMKYNFYGHFFITTNKIGTKAFLTKEQIIELHKSGHIIGAHSHTHPKVISNLKFEEIKYEWEKSKTILEEIIGEKVETASVPGGFYSNSVAEAAHQVGFKYLFTSEPESKLKKYKDMYLVPRYTVFDYHTPELIGKFVANNKKSLAKEWLWWNIKKVIKKSTGPLYFQIRKILVKK